MRTIPIAVAAALTAVAGTAFAQPRGDTYPYDGDHRPEADNGYYAGDAYDHGPRDNGRYGERGRYDEGQWRDERRGRRARVLEVRPVYSARDAHEECWNDSRNQFERLANPGTVIGALAGGVIGHQFDSGAATAAGAIVGGLIGNQVHKDRSGDENRGQRRCRVVSEHGARPLAYDVRYQYRGNDYVERLDHDPGQWLRVGRETQPDGTPLAYNGPARDDERR